MRKESKVRIYKVVIRRILLKQDEIQIIKNWKIKPTWKKNLNIRKLIYKCDRNWNICLTFNNIQYENYGILLISMCTVIIIMNLYLVYLTSRRWNKTSFYITLSQYAFWSRCQVVDSLETAWRVFAHPRVYKINTWICCFCFIWEWNIVATVINWLLIS